MLRTVVLACAVAWAAPASAQVQLAIDDGRVTLHATNATMSQILAEWAKVGQTRIVNGDRVPGNVVAFELSDVSESDALEIILRSVSGYVLAPRPTPIRNASRYDRILILPTSSPVRAPATAAVVPTSAPFPRPQFSPPPVREDDAQPADAGPTPAGPRAGFNVFPQQPPTQAAPPPPSGPVTAPAVPAGASTPGVVAPPPAQPGQPTGSTTMPRR
jgi:hypothetical protein